MRNSHRKNGLFNSPTRSDPYCRIYDCRLLKEQPLWYLSLYALPP